MKNKKIIFKKKLFDIKFYGITKNNQEKLLLGISKIPFNYETQSLDSLFKTIKDFIKKMELFY